MPFSAVDRQKQIYLEGLNGFRPAVSIDANKLEENARAHMSQRAFAYVAGGAGAESSMRLNREEFEKIRIVPRMLCNVEERDLSIELFGKKLSSPLLLAPVGVLELVHPEADLAVARAAAQLGVPFIFSNQASYPMEACASVMNGAPHWFQLYWSKSNDLITSFIQRAEKCGCSAIVVTLDTTLLGWRPRDLDLGYLPFLEGKGIAQYTSDPVFDKMLEEPEQTERLKRKVNLQSIQALVTMVNKYPGNNFFKKLKSGKPLRAIRKFVDTYSNSRTTWDGLKFLRAQTKLPILLKGILHPEDALKAIDNGMDGIYVSNHGGRQVDGSIAAISALPEIVRVVKGKVPILLDSGVRGGADAFKALALGATAVCIGRPYAYGLAIAGQRGVNEVLMNVMSDLELTMGLAGCKNIPEINRSMIA
ncbi:MAG TPA: lactate 2-monooxygenase [Chryseolinea sp.]|nr:lactate 2-monooxygenase [Chryseolinea sp.]